MKYQELAVIIKKDIENGVYQNTEKLPTEDQLMSAYQVSRYCVRNAVNILMGMGYVYPVQGSGMFIRESKREGCMSLRNTLGVTEELSEKNVETRVAHLELIPAGAEIAKRMKCRVGTPLYYLIRVRKVDGELLSVEYTYYNKEIVGELNEEIAQGSLFGYIRKTLGLNIGFADKILYCDKLSKEAAAYLELEEGDPAIVIEDDVYLANGNMFNASHVYYHYKRAKFFELAEIK